MAYFYRTFQGFRTVFYAVIAGFFILSAPAYAQSAVFTVSDVQVDVTAENALAARDQAFEKAQIDAFSILVERMLPEDQFLNFTPPDAATISSLVKDFEVTKEKLSAVQYIGTYTFRFKDKEVKNYLGQSGVEYADVGSRANLIIPYYQDNGQMILWSRSNPWMEAWSRLEGRGGLVPVVVPLGDLEDVRDIGDDEALTYDERGLARLVNRYQAGEAVLAIAVPDVALSADSPPDAPVNGALSINIYRTDRARPELTQQIVVQAGNGDTRAAFFDKAVARVQRELQRDWKAKTLVREGQRGRLQVKVKYASLQEWSETQQALGRVYGIEEMEIKSLNPYEAELDLVFQGDERRLRLALQQANFILSEPNISAPAFDNGSSYTGWGRQEPVNSGQPLVYELSLRKYDRSSSAPASAAGVPVRPAPGSGYTRPQYTPRQSSPYSNQF